MFCQLTGLRIPVPDRLRKRLLCGESLSEIRRGLAVCGEPCELARHEDLARETVSPTPERLLDAYDLDEIGADADDQPCAPIAARMAALTMRVFISRTASRMPTNTARLTMRVPDV